MMLERIPSTMHKTALKLQQLYNSKQIITINVAIGAAGTIFNHLGDLSSLPVRGSTTNFHKIALFGIMFLERNVFPHI